MTFGKNKIMSIKNTIDSKFVKKLIDENLLFFFIVSQISSDNTLEKSSIENRLNIIKSVKYVMTDTFVKDRDMYLDLLSDCEEILLKELKDLSKKKLKIWLFQNNFIYLQCNYLTKID